MIRTTNSTTHTRLYLVAREYGLPLASEILHVQRENDQ